MVSPDENRSDASNVVSRIGLSGKVWYLRGALVLCFSSSCATLLSDERAATPQRPTISSDTSTTVEGTFEVEAGGAVDSGTLVDTPVTLKYGVGPATEIFSGWSPFFQSDEDDEEGIGDLVLGVRHRFMEDTDASPSAAIQATVKLPTADADAGLGSGELDASFAGILVESFGAVGVTAYYSIDLLGESTGGLDVGHHIALAAGVPLSERFGTFGEIGGIFVPEQSSDEVLSTIGLTYCPRASLVFDLGVIVGLSDDATDFQLVFGLTQNLGPRRPGEGPSSRRR